MDHVSSGSHHHGGGGGGGSSRGRRLGRSKAIKNVEYDAGSAAVEEDSPSLSAHFEPHPPAAAYSTITSFRMGGIDGEVDEICRSLGLSGPEDFAIPPSVWEEARRSRLSSDLFLFPASRDSLSRSPPTVLTGPDSYDPVEDPPRPALRDEPEDRLQPLVETRRACDGVRRAVDNLEIELPKSIPVFDSLKIEMPKSTPGLSLNPPPPISLPRVDDRSSTWDILRSFAPNEDEARAAPSRDEDEDSAAASDCSGRRSMDSEEGEMEDRDNLRSGDTDRQLHESTSGTAGNVSTMPPIPISASAILRRSMISWTRGNQLGSGSFGTVFEAMSNDGFFLAVKEVSLLDQGNDGRQSISQLEQEIALLSRLEHENLIQLYGTDKDSSKLYIFLELATQGSLMSLYQKYRLQYSQVSAYTRQILEGLNYLHNHNVVHRDIKCANILVDANGSVKLADFGLAKEISDLNQAKSCKGTVFWMAPEVVKTKPYGPSADIWSLGCTVLEMLTRRPPYNTEWIEAFYKIGRGELPHIPNSLSEESRNFIRMCLQFKPEDRPSAARLLKHPFVKRSRPDSAGSAHSSPMKAGH